MKKKLLLGTAFAVFSLQTAFAAALTLPPVDYRAAEVYIPFGATHHDAHGIGLQPAHMLAATMPVDALTYAQIRNHFIGAYNNGFISTMPLANDDYTSPYDEPGHTHGMHFEQNENGVPLSKAEQLAAFRNRLHQVWDYASCYEEFSTLITKLYNVANEYRMQHNINRTAFDKEFILSLFTSSTIAYVGEGYRIPKASCGKGAVERITMDLSTYRYLEHFPQATREMSDALKSIIGFFNGQGGINSLIQGNNWVDYCDNFGPVQLAVTRQAKLDALMTQCINGFFKIISANNANMDAYARRYPQRPSNFNAYDHSTRAFPLMPGAPERITFEAAIRSALKQYASIPNLQMPLVDYNDWLDFAEDEIAEGHRQGAKLRATAPQAAEPEIDMARYIVPNIQFTLEEIASSGGVFMYQDSEIQPQNWGVFLERLEPVLRAHNGGIPDELAMLTVMATSCSADYIIFTIDHFYFHATELLVPHNAIPGRRDSFIQPARQQHADANNVQLDAEARALRAMVGIQPAAVEQQAVLPAAEGRFPVVSFRTVTLDGEFEDDFTACGVNDRYIGNSPFSGILTGLLASDAQRIENLAADSMENGAVVSCNELLRDNPRFVQLSRTYPGLGEALRSDFARGRSIAFFRFNAATMNEALDRPALERDHYVFTIGNVRTTDTAAPTQPIVAPQPVVQPALPVVQPAQPVVQPAQPVVQPAQPVVQAVQPVVQAAQPVVQAVQPVVQAVQPVVQAVQPVVQAVQPVVQAVQPVVQPAQPVVQQPVQPWQRGDMSLAEYHQMLNSAVQRGELPLAEARSLLRSRR